MLVEFSAANFLSIKEKVTLSLLASKDNSLDHHLITQSPLKNQSLLKASAIFGANASGKSNLLKAVSFFQDFILNSHKMQQGDEINVLPFKLDENFTAKPGEFQIIFIYDGIRYAYGFSLDKTKVHEEYLYYYPMGRQATIFERNNTYDYIFNIDKKEQRAISSRTPVNTLYLSSATRWNYQKTAAPFQWLRKHLNVITAQEKISCGDFTAKLIAQNPHIVEIVNRFFREADLGIDAIHLSKRPIETKVASIPPKYGDYQSSDFFTHDSFTLYTRHVGVDEKGNKKELYFKLEEESDGTQKFFLMLGPIIEVLMNGYVLFIDELESSLHPHLTRFLLNLFHNPEQNKNNAQLVFTAHDTNLLDLLRRDQVWFTERHPGTGSTDLYSLLEFSPRKDQNIQKGYLAGRYGAVPFLGDSDIL
jgi:AAA15 family ATPase/GTPase